MLVVNVVNEEINSSARAILTKKADFFCCKIRSPSNTSDVDGVERKNYRLYQLGVTTAAQK